MIPADTAPPALHSASPRRKPEAPRQHWTHRQRVVFEPVSLLEQLHQELHLIGSDRPMVIASERQRERAGLHGLGGANGTAFTDVAQHVPEELVERAVTAARSSTADSLIAVGGGSATGLAKAIALSTSLPIIAVPSTYSGSEVTNIWGITRGGQKLTGTDDRVVPRVIVYDTAMTSSMPPGLVATSGLNALAHAVDSFWATGANPAARESARSAIRLLAQVLPRLVADVTDPSARPDAFVGAYLAGSAFASTGSGLHHKLCHVLGGSFGLPHADVHSILLPHVAAYNAPAAPGIDADIAQHLGALAGTSASAALSDLGNVLAAPRRLRDLQISQEDLAAAAALALPLIPHTNPRPSSVDSLTRLLRGAW